MTGYIAGRDRIHSDNMIDQPVGEIFFNIALKSPRSGQIVIGLPESAFNIHVPQKLLMLLAVLFSGGKLVLFHILLF
jgi:hypothetical protein